MKCYVKAALAIIAFLTTLPETLTNGLVSLSQSDMLTAKLLLWTADLILAFGGLICLLIFPPMTAAILTLVLILLGCLRSLPFLGMNANKLNLLICLLVFSLNCSYLTAALRRYVHGLPRHSHYSRMGSEVQ